MGSLLFKRVEQTRNLPDGHIDAKKAWDALSKEYDLSREVETKWQKRLRRSKKDLCFKSPVSALAFCNSVCDAVGQRHIKKITFGTVKTVGAGGEYCQGEIRCLSHGADVRVLIHELTHHCGRSQHDRLFCDLEETLFCAAYPILTGKSIHTDW